PGGICTVDSSESIPFREVEGIGTPMTGRIVCAAITPARCAAPPAPAMITLIPRSAAFLAKSAERSGERCADVTSISQAIPKSSSAFPASRMISRSESLPITIETSGLFIISPLKLLGFVILSEGLHREAKQTAVEGSLLPRQNSGVTTRMDTDQG